MARTVKIIKGRHVEYADARDAGPRAHSNITIPCLGCYVMYKKTKDHKYLGGRAAFAGLYTLALDGSPYRVYFHDWEPCGAVAIAPTHFKLCTRRNLTVEYDTHKGHMHYVSCLEPTFACPDCRRDLPPHHWFCPYLDASPEVRFSDVVDTEWFKSLGREIIAAEDAASSAQAVSDWIHNRKLSRR